ncbi:MAG TPA: N-acetyl-gamma-glutamyl-phosphate reductase [Bacillus sp. (in: firmicutes)]|uniref:N-acetyl-gamma-glutamyl-phosphate reductase n=1 Tax=Bacillus litorisediminis TaxID=2922713 RepID=UPI001FADB61E|nr:N-acetyl-gamma-glutamyl-phosphate reductase [Bacillus litorisediminis]HWO75763.1 N-acetyl-gamma-glutamyl-phosphate reductase [Bacillus sp. (in: firmicutes)]
MKAAIVGGTGYSAVELIRLLQHHPYIELETVISHSTAGSEMDSIYPHLSHIIETPLSALDIDSLSEAVDVIFFATPSGVSREILPKFLENGLTCIDLSGDFRLKSQTEYEKWYKKSAADQGFLDTAVYGLSEIYQEKIKEAKLIANPGCYPTAALLALIPAVQHKLIDYQSIIIDAKSGVSGAGRGLSLGSLYSEVNENLKAYKIGAHQHIPEIEQILNEQSGESFPVTLTTHLVPMTRGIMTTIYANLNNHIKTDEIIDIYKDFYQDHPFIRIRKQGVIPATKEVYGSNYCDIGFLADERTGRLTIVSVIDNLVKGASGQAIQNINIINGWDVQTGLKNIPLYP